MPMNKLRKFCYIFILIFGWPTLQNRHISTNVINYETNVGYIDGMLCQTNSNHFHVDRVNWVGVLFVDVWLFAHLWLYLFSTLFIEYCISSWNAGNQLGLINLNMTMYGVCIAFVLAWIDTVRYKFNLNLKKYCVLPTEQFICHIFFSSISMRSYSPIINCISAMWCLEFHFSTLYAIS